MVVSLSYLLHVKKDIEIVKCLVEHGLDLNKEGNNYWILLFHLC